jgi:hypothetical protein
MTVSINPSAYLLRIHIGFDGELVFYKNNLLCLKQFYLQADGKTIETAYWPATADLMAVTQIPDNASSYEAYPLRVYIENDNPQQVQVSFKGRPIGLFHKVELALTVAQKAQIRLYHREPLPKDLQEELLDAKVELHQEYDDASV